MQPLQFGLRPAPAFMERGENEKCIFYPRESWEAEEEEAEEEEEEEEEEAPQPPLGSVAELFIIAENIRRVAEIIRAFLAMTFELARELKTLASFISILSFFFLAIMLNETGIWY